MPDHFTDEEVEALKAGLEGVTPGPWYRDGALVYALDDTEVCNRFSAGVQRGWISRGRTGERDGLATD